jgi:hypothetical protein
MYSWLTVVGVGWIRAGRIRLTATAVNEIPSQHFDGHGPCGLLVSSAPDDSHATPSNYGFQYVVTDSLASYHPPASIGG